MSDTYVVTSSGSPALEKATILKDPQAVLDFTINWQPWLDDVLDSLVSKSVTVSTIAGDASPLVVVQSAISGKSVVIWLSGGSAGNTYQVTCHITTASTPARQDDRSIFIKVKDR